MTKDEMRDEILRIDPENQVANSATSSHAALKREMKEVQLRAAAAPVQDAPPEELLAEQPVELAFRREGELVKSWKLRLPNGEYATELEFGEELPKVGTMVGVLKVVSRAEDLAIVAGDLPVREKFDPRRLYTTSNGTSVVFKRVERGRIVLWSYRAQGEIAIGAKVPLTWTANLAQPAAAQSRRLSQKIYAAWAIAQNPEISGKELTELLREKFPGSNIGSRHGPHYLSLSRNAKLPEPPDEDPSNWERE